MKNGQCPKCGANEVRVRNGKITMSVGPLSDAALDNYVCINCGYVESYVARESMHKISEIAEKWSVVRSMNQTDQVTNQSELSDILL